MTVVPFGITVKTNDPSSTVRRKLLRTFGAAMVHTPPGAPSSANNGTVPFWSFATPSQASRNVPPPAS